ncbi:MAG TPA: manganese efflux pump [Candidatus Dormibacteraeota bacterium]|nr:manganese efflux pump [Candidatus Dormibacteraeota bacterium]
MARVIALVIPLGLDTFAIAAAIGMTGLTGRQRLRLSAVFAAFEAGMPIVGLLIGASLGTVIGSLSEYLAIAALAVIGLYMLFGPDDEERVKKLAAAGGPAMIGLGLSVSLDELAIGFSLGLLNVPIVPAIVLIAAQAFIVSQVGFALGGKIGDATREGAERLAGAVLLAIAGVLLVTKILAGSHLA